jgi:hypothetical protein
MALIAHMNMRKEHRYYSGVGSRLYVAVVSCLRGHMNMIGNIMISGYMACITNVVLVSVSEHI